MAKILVVDDSRSALAVTEMSLVEAGHEVVVCSDGEIALGRIRRERFDLIVTDIYMPGHDGLEVLIEARRHWPAVPVVAMSGVTGRGDMLKVAKCLGACHTILKPCSRADLLDAVAVALGGSPPGASPLAAEAPLAGKGA
jgi:CheY-like chemotaxis protein